MNFLNGRNRKMKYRIEPNNMPIVFASDINEAWDEVCKIPSGVRFVVYDCETEEVCQEFMPRWEN